MTLLRDVELSQLSFCGVVVEGESVFGWYVRTVPLAYVPYDY